MTVLRTQHVGGRILPLHRCWVPLLIMEIPVDCTLTNSISPTIGAQNNHSLQREANICTSKCSVAEINGRDRRLVRKRNLGSNLNQSWKRLSVYLTWSNGRSMAGMFSNLFFSRVILIRHGHLPFNQFTKSRFVSLSFLSYNFNGTSSFRHS